MTVLVLKNATKNQVMAYTDDVLTEHLHTVLQVLTDDLPTLVGLLLAGQEGGDTPTLVLAQGVCAATK